MMERGPGGRTGYISFNENNTRRGYVGYSTSTELDLRGDAGVALNFGTNATADRLRIQTDGRVNIGSATTVDRTLCVGGGTSTGGIRVTGYTNEQIGTSYGFLNISGGVGVSSGVTNYSIRAEQRIAATEFNATSDVRIKKEITDLCDEQALETLRLVEPKFYKHIDRVTRGDDSVIGFIAQQIKEVLPKAVTVISGVVPDIYAVGDIGEDGKTVTLRDKILDFTGTHKIEIKIFDKTDRLITTDKVMKITVLSPTTIEMEESVDDTIVFLFGRYIDDFHYLNKDVIFTVATAALQEVDRQLQSEKIKTATLESKVSNLESQLQLLIDRVTQLESRV
jgi:hypothetical protein